jgi:hypothetical protein
VISYDQLTPQISVQPLNSISLPQAQPQQIPSQAPR